MASALEPSGGAGNVVILSGALLLAFIAGLTDFRSRRIPNWLTVSAFALGVAAHSFYGGWSGLKTSLLGTVVGLGLLLPFVLLRSLGNVVYLLPPYCIRAGELDRIYGAIDESLSFVRV